MAHSMLKVVEVKWTGRSPDEPPPWEELQDKLHGDEVMNVQVAFTVQEGEGESKHTRVVVIGEQSF